MRMLETIICDLEKSSMELAKAHQKHQRFYQEYQQVCQNVRKRMENNATDTE